MAGPRTRRELTDLLDSTWPDLLGCIEPNDILVSELIKNKVAQNVWCLNLGEKRLERVTDILDLVHAGTLAQFEAFVRSLMNAGQVVRQLSKWMWTFRTKAPFFSPEGQLLPIKTDSAPGGPRPPTLWEKDHPDGVEIVMFAETTVKDGDPRKYKDLFNSKQAELAKVVKIERLWPLLKSLGVLDQAAIAVIQSNRTEHQQVDAFIDHMERCQLWKMHAFLHVCVLDERHDEVFSILNIEKAIYKTES